MDLAHDLTELDCQFLPPDVRRFPNGLRSLILDFQNHLSGTLEGVTYNEILKYDVPDGFSYERNYHLMGNKIGHIGFTKIEESVLIDDFYTINGLARWEQFLNGCLMSSRDNILSKFGFEDKMNLIIKGLGETILKDAIGFTKGKGLSNMHLKSKENSLGFYFKIFKKFKEEGLISNFKFGVEKYFYVDL